MIGKSIALLATCFLITGCAISTGYRTGGAGEPSSDQASVLISVTGVELVSGGPARAEFWRQMRQLNEVLPNQPGLIGYRLRREFIGNRAWTMSIWQDRAAMRSFVRSQGHATAMKQGTAGVTDMAFVTFEVPGKDLPVSWDDALSRLEKDGRPYAY